MKYSDIYRLIRQVSRRMQFIRRSGKCPSMTATNSTKTVLRCILPASMETRRGSRYFLNVMPNPTRRMQTVPPRFISLGRTSAGRADEDKLKEIAVMLMEQGAKYTAFGQEYNGPYRVRKEPSFQDGGSDHRFRSTRQLNRP